MDPSEPVEPPNTQGKRHVENRLADFCVALTYFRFHLSHPSCVMSVRQARTFRLPEKAPSSLTAKVPYVNDLAVFSPKNGRTAMRKDARLFDIIVLAGMVVNIILAVFLILYYFDFL